MRYPPPGVYNLRLLLMGNFRLLLKIMQNWIFEIKNQLIIVLTYVFGGMNKYIFPLLFSVCFTNAAIPEKRYLFGEIQKVMLPKNLQSKTLAYKCKSPKIGWTRCPEKGN